MIMAPVDAVATSKRSLGEMASYPPPIGRVIGVSVR